MTTGLIGEVRPMADCRLYGILDLGYVDRGGLVSMAEQMIAGGIDVVQLRAKGFSADDIAEMGIEILPLTRAAEVPFIVNDFPEVAAAIGADGVHVGQDDQSMAEVRSIVGPEMIVGRSTHSLAQARAAAIEPADYIGFGPLFATPTKPEYIPIGTDDISEVHREHPDLPIFCIGGIKRETVPALVNAGARRVVIVSGILLAEDVAGYVASVKAMLD